MGVRWDAGGLGEKLWAAVERNAKNFNAQDIANIYWRLTRWGCVGMLCLEALAKSCGQRLT